VASFRIPSRRYRTTDAVPRRVYSSDDAELALLLSSVLDWRRHMRCARSCQTNGQVKAALELLERVVAMHLRTLKLP
jgi:hypothetical protein